MSDQAGTSGGNAGKASITDSIRCILSDVDGVMTDGQIIYDSAGNETKAFHVRDGLGIKKWMNAGFTFAIITARTSPMVDRRARELGIENLFQGSGDKLSTAEKVLAELGYTFADVCYLGDDLPDIPVMRSAALAVAPADASQDARDAADWITEREGGRGAVRETIESLLRSKGLWNSDKA